MFIVVSQSVSHGIRQLHLCIKYKFDSCHQSPCTRIHWAVGVMQSHGDFS